MRPLKVEDVEIDLCPVCQGMWFDARELSRAAGLRFDDRATGAAMAGARRTTRRCPLCTVPLYEREVDPGSGIFVDQCPKCSGMFLEREEFSRTRAHYRAKGAPERARRTTIRERASTPSGQIDPESGGALLFQYLTSLPLELDVPQTLFPPAVMALIAVNVAVLVVALASGLEARIDSLGLVPADIVRGRRLHTFITSMFMHAGLFHLLGNMYFLYVAGDNLEERFGWLKFLGLYLLCGLVADVAHVVGEMSSTLPTVGASGAVAGVLGAYVVLFPHVRFRVRWFYLLWMHVSFDIPAWAYFGMWILFQVICAVLELPAVAWWAHIGGFACGAGVALAAKQYGSARSHDRAGGG